MYKRNAMVQARQLTNLKIQAPTAKTVKQSIPRYILELQNIDLKECAQAAADSNTMMLIILVKRNGLHEE
ncbi:hypothetical protein BOTCAL_0034g00060 [Botryotinia calthae]|uniref:Uncharacterized protein n=1 Tax=Botryotinia calthae TaxID=38488 RepID=A0A4Y8DFH6_9HELO|nr:hypothetical protein BOTCAL_0034g00060 [Botryotinia calthae]